MRSAIAGVQVVTNCDDSGPGSLRAALAAAGEADGIDFSSLTCDTISLVSGEIEFSADRLYIGANITISGGGLQRIFAHHGTGKLTISGLTLEDGRAWNGLVEKGGCVYSSGTVYLRDVTLSGCVAAAAPQPVTVSISRGGGIYALRELRIEDSLITGCKAQAAYASYAYAYGGGVASGGDITISGSTLEGNTITGQGPFGFGSAIEARGSLFVSASTISGNGLAATTSMSFGNGQTTSRFLDVTVSGNTGGIVSGDSLLRIWNSTIVFNGTTGVYAANYDAQLDLRGSIIAHNVSRDDRVESDVQLNFGSDNPIIGSANLILQSNQPLPPDTIQSAPVLGALADNGGPTKTHALLTGSPAIDHGVDLGEPFDQRGTGHPRVVGAGADIGAYELSLTDRLLASGFD